MDRELRERFNAAYTEDRYQELRRSLYAEAGSPIEFRICETPLFLTAELTRELSAAAGEILGIVTSADYLERSARAVPEGCRVPGEEGHPEFLQIDFALARGEDGGPGGLGGLVPRLIELQGFPSLYGFQWLLAREYQKAFGLPEGLTPYFSGLDEAGYAARLAEAILGGHDPAEVVLLELEPERQKTRVDFVCTERLTGVETICATKVIERGDKLFRLRNGREVPIRRIYNRLIFDELDSAKAGLGAEERERVRGLFQRPHDVEWAGHPNWFFRISKFSLPYIRSRYAPPSHFLSDLREYPADLGNYVLKPLHSFAGQGVVMDVTPAVLDAVERRADHILQRKVEYGPAVATPDGPAKAEVRMMYLWPEGGRPALVNNLVRMTKGAMVGVDFNKDKTWIGASVAFHPPVD